MSDEYLDPYREAMSRFGPRFEATLWSSRRAQLLRFDVLTDMVDLTGKRLLDAGCGLADLYHHLATCRIALDAYIGIDGLPEMIRQLQQEQQQKSPKMDNAEFLVGDFISDPTLLSTGNPDVIFFSGSLNTFEQSRAQHVIQQAFDHAREAVVFNFLSDRCPQAAASLDTGPANRFNTTAMLDFALTVTTQVRFRQDYLDGHDATIGILKRPA
ncbi:MAG: methyltransferase domain-containing protein [Planctomycetes bacterium]|nr:methyltransferase domain-containing protein [Planctomycetota bacterium]